MAQPYKIDVNGEWSFTMDQEALTPYDMVRLGAGTLHVLKDHQPFEAEVLQADFIGKRYRIAVNGKTYSVALSDDLDQQIARMGFEMGSASAVARIEAPMPGLILDIGISEGDSVAEGDPLLVLEAMKMENVILSPRDGVIKKIAVSRGAAVDKKDLLVEFE